jgi:hypothetical protein
MRRTPPKPYYSFGHMPVAVGLLAGFVAGCASQSASEFQLRLDGWQCFGGPRWRGLLRHVAAFHLRVVLGEEPWLAIAHGEQWRQ